MHGVVMTTVGGWMRLLSGVARSEDRTMGIKAVPVHAICTMFASI